MDRLQALVPKHPLPVNTPPPSSSNRFFPPAVAADYADGFEFVSFGASGSARGGTDPIHTAAAPQSTIGHRRPPPTPPICGHGRRARGPG
jgi:hypothetical protein